MDIGAHEVDSPDMGKEFIRGDANESGLVDISDPVFIWNWLVYGGPPPVCRDAADANDDERNDVSDVTFLLHILFQEPTGDPHWFPPPYPECGVDPFGFTLFCSENKPAPGCAP